MVQNIGSNRNTNDAATLHDGIQVNASTSTKIVDVNLNRLIVLLWNNGNQDVWIKLQPAADDDDKKGFVLKAQGYWEMPIGNSYTGEISAIAKSDNPIIYVTEY